MKKRTELSARIAHIRLPKWYPFTSHSALTIKGIRDFRIINPFHLTFAVKSIVLTGHLLQGGFSFVVRRLASSPSSQTVRSLL